MDIHDLTRDLNVRNAGKLVLLVADGLGGLPMEPGGKTELETARTPNLDALVRRGVCGLSIPVLPGIAPGSGPGHLGLFGYDPLKYRIGRGVLEALGIDFDVGPDDVAVRGNFCTVDEAGKITDRRAGRISTETCVKLVEKLRAGVKIDSVELFVEPVREYRFVLVLRGEGLGDHVDDTDPQATGVPPLEPHAPGDDAASQRTAALAAEFVRQARDILRDEHPANMLTLRGFSRRPKIPTFEDAYGLRARAIAVYPMYRGLARLVGMSVDQRRFAGAPRQSLAAQIERARADWNDFDFFFLHFKYTDSTGEDGNFAEKVKRIEELDAELPPLIGGMNFDTLPSDVLVVTGDHSTPSKLRSHSWHPVPTLLAAASCRTDAASTFGESVCLNGGLGQFEAKYLLPMMLAHAERLQKYGA